MSDKENQASFWVRPWIQRPVPLIGSLSGILMFEWLLAAALNVMAHHSVHSYPH